MNIGLLGEFMLKLTPNTHTHTQKTASCLAILRLTTILFSWENVDSYCAHNLNFIFLYHFLSTSSTVVLFVFRSQLFSILFLFLALAFIGKCILNRKSKRYTTQRKRSHNIQYTITLTLTHTRTALKHIWLWRTRFHLPNTNKFACFKWCEMIAI